MTSTVASGTPPPRQKGFLRRITVVTAVGQGLDGYDLGGISVVIPLLAGALGVTPLWAGLIGASSLIGIFFGGPIFGYLTDRVGRRLMFTIDLGAFIICGLLQMAVTEPWQLFVVRVMLGFAIGAEYAIGAPLLAEFVPASVRGHRLAGLEVMWYVGYLVAVIVSYAMLAIPGMSWRFVLATATVPALVCLLLRIGMPESPRWLMSVGRVDQARKIVHEYLGEAQFRAQEIHNEARARQGGLGRLFQPGYRSRTVFACLFYACLVAPYFAIFTFAPEVLSSLDLSDPRVGTVATNGVAAVGCLAGMLVIERVGRRRLVIVPFWITAIALFVLGVWSHAPAAIVVLCFTVFAFFNSAASTLTVVYPNEVFPTDVRTTGSGLATAASRVGAAVGTFLLPVGISAWGVGPTMLVGAAVCVLGALVSHAWAPETTGQTLTAATRSHARIAPVIPH